MYEAKEYSRAGRTAISEAIIRGLLETTTALGVQTLAFGIEDTVHWQRCRELGFSCGQGTFLGSPSRIDDLGSEEAAQPSLAATTGDAL